MSIRPPALDDRSFDDLVSELIARIPAHTPEWTNPVAGDPGRTLIDLFAWLGDALLYRVNLIPERQRLAFLKLLGEQMRPAAAATGIISLAPAQPDAATAVTLAKGALVKGPVNFETLSEITVLPLTGQCYIKQTLSQEQLKSKAISDTIAGLSKIYQIDVRASVPYQTTVVFDQNQANLNGIDLSTQTVDGSLWVALLAGPKADVTAVRASLGSGEQQVLLNVGFAPAMQVVGVTTDVSSNRPPIQHNWQISLKTLPKAAPQYVNVHELGDPTVGDTTRGLTRPGVIRLELPQASDLGVPENDVHLDPNAGTQNRPPRIDDLKLAARLVTWLRLTPADAMKVSWLGINAVEIDQRQTSGGKIIGVSDGSADQVYPLGQTSVDPNTLQLQVDMEGVGYVVWTRTDDLNLASPNDTMYELDSEAGTVQFGDGVRGMLPPRGRRIRVQSMRSGGGAQGNLPPQSLTAITAVDLNNNQVTGLKVIQSLSTTGGADSESLASAEQRIPAILKHRDRVVTIDDYRALAQTVPGSVVGRVEVLSLFHPQNLQNNIPGVVSVMVLPKRDQISLPNPRPDRTMLETVFAYLEPRKPLATEMYVIGCDYRGIGLSIGISVRNGFGPDTVASQVTAALKQALWPLPPGGFLGAGYPLGKTVRTLELEIIAANVPGVDEVTGINLFERLPSGVYSQITQPDNKPVALELLSYQLPELLKVVVVTTSEGQTAVPPTSLDADDSGGAGGTGGGGIPIPIVPEVC
jgi:baseplate J-like protein